MRLSVCYNKNRDINTVIKGKFKCKFPKVLILRVLHNPKPLSNKKGIRHLKQTGKSNGYSDFTAAQI